MRPNSSLLRSLSQAGVKSIQLVGHVKTIIAGKSARTKERNNTNEKTEYQSSNASHAAPKIAMSTNQPSITTYHAWKTNAEKRDSTPAHDAASNAHKADTPTTHKYEARRKPTTEHRQQRRQQRRDPQEQKPREKRQCS